MNKRYFRKLRSHIQLHFSSLNKDEWVIVTALFVQSLSWMPSIEGDLFGGTRVSLSLLSGVVIIVGAWALAGRKVFVDVLRNPTVWVLVWAIYATALSLLMTDDFGSMGLRLAHVLSVITGGLVAATLVDNGYANARKIIEAFTYVALVLTPVFMLQYFLAVHGVESLELSSRVGVFTFPRLSGFSSSAVYFASWLLVPALYAIYKLRGQGRFFWFMSIVLSSMMFLTLSRGPIFSFVIGVLAMSLLVKGYTARWQPFVPVLAGLVVTLGIVSYSGLVNNQSIHEAPLRYLDQLSVGVFNPEGAQNTTPPSSGDSKVIDTSVLDTKGVVEAPLGTRQEALSVGFDSIKENPITGVGLLRGPDDFDDSLYNTYDSDRFTSLSLPVDILVASGLVGLALIGYVVQSYGSRIYRKRSVLLIFMMAILVNSSLFSNWADLTLWFIVGLLLIFNDERELSLGRKKIG